MGLLEKVSKEGPDKEIKEVKPRFIAPKEKISEKAEHISLDSGRLHVHRDKENIIKKEVESKIEPREKIEKEELHSKPAETKKPDMGSIKTAIEAKLKKTGENELDTSDIKSIIEQRLKKKVKEEKPGAEKRIHTGIPGLDDVMEGGFRKYSVNLIGGGAGSGKSIFCMQFLVEGIDKYNENGVYISFEQDQKRILEDFKRFNWNLEKKIEEKKLVILHYTPEQVEKVLEAGGGTVRDVIESSDAKRLVIDSLTAFTLLHENELTKRKVSLQLFDAVHKWGCTALMISEQEPDPEKHKSNVMEFEADGVILLYNVRKGDIRERSLEIFKMRAVRHAAKIFPMKIDDKGIIIFPEETVF